MEHEQNVWLYKRKMRLMRLSPNTNKLFISEVWCLWALLPLLVRMLYVLKFPKRTSIIIMYVCQYRVVECFPSSQDIQDDMSDMLEQTNEIMEVLGTPYGLPDDVDENDLEAGEETFLLKWFYCWF